MKSHSAQEHNSTAAAVCPAGDSAPSSRRRMVRAELLGQHTHETVDGQKVHVWKRDGVFLARGRHLGKAFGQTLGRAPEEASAALRRLLVQLEDGTFRHPSEARKRPLKTGLVPRQNVRQLCDAFLADKRRLLGRKTACDYRARLTPVIEFAEQSDSRGRWSLAVDVDRQFALELKRFLYHRKVSRNGRPAAKKRNLSPRQIYNILDCARTLFSWAKRPEVNELPSTFVNPFTEDIVGRRGGKDLLRPSPLPLERRIALVGAMDEWQLCHFAVALVLPLRPEDQTGLLISEVDFAERILSFGTRLRGWDFNKGRRSFHVTFPPELEPLLRKCVDSRKAGPLFRRRTVFEGRLVLCE